MKQRITLAAAIGVLVIIFGTIYGVGQQIQRSDANYPQIQLAEDKAAQLNTDPSAKFLRSLPHIDMRTSLAPFTIVYDKAGNVISGSGSLDGSVPKAPMGILTAAQGQPYHAVTWQPDKNVRIAAVTVDARGYYVLSGRSLTEVEKNESKTFRIALLGGILSLVVVGAAVVAKKAISK